jgi:hypothetical protein
MTWCVQQKLKMHHFFLLKKVQLFCTCMFCKLGSVDRLHSEIMQSIGEKTDLFEVPFNGWINASVLRTTPVNICCCSVCSTRELIYAASPTRFKYKSFSCPLLFLLFINWCDVNEMCAFSCCLTIGPLLKLLYSLLRLYFYFF